MKKGKNSFKNSVWNEFLIMYSSQADKKLSGASLSGVPAVFCKCDVNRDEFKVRKILSTVSVKTIVLKGTEPVAQLKGPGKQVEDGGVESRDSTVSRPVGLVETCYDLQVHCQPAWVQARVEEKNTWSKRKKGQKEAGI